METKNIMIVGVGGQGTLLTSRILGSITTKAGYDVKLSEVHGMAQRGGSVVTFVRYGDKVNEPIVEEGQADVLIAFEKLEAMRYAHFLKKDGVIIVNDYEIAPMTVVTGNAKYPENIINLGQVVQSLLDINLDSPYLIYANITKASIHSKDIAWSIDGEYGGVTDQAIFEVYPKAIQIKVPKG